MTENRDFSADELQHVEGRKHCLESLLVAIEIVEAIDSSINDLEDERATLSELLAKTSFIGQSSERASLHRRLDSLNACIARLRQTCNEFSATAKSFPFPEMCRKYGASITHCAGDE